MYYSHPPMVSKQTSRRTFFGLFSLLVASSFAIFVFSLMVARAQREARKSAVEARQLGQYTLEAKIGAGGMGVVYRGHHAMLRRMVFGGIGMQILKLNGHKGGRDFAEKAGWQPQGRGFADQWRPGVRRSLSGRSGIFSPGVGQV